MKIAPIATRLLDTSKQWLLVSTTAFAVTFILHAIANGWIGPWAGHNLYNDSATSWIGSYPVDVMHFLAGFSIAAVIFNLNLGTSKRSYMLTPVLLTIVAIQTIGLCWEWLELVYFGAHPGGFIQVDLRDTLFDETMDLVGGVVAVIMGEHLTV